MHFIFKELMTHGFNGSRVAAKQNVPSTLLSARKLFHQLSQQDVPVYLAILASSPKQAWQWKKASLEIGQ